MTRTHQKLLALLLSLMMAMGLVANVAAAQRYTPGTYTATAAGHNGDMTVEVVVDENTILSVTVTDHEETAGIVDTPLSRIPTAIVDARPWPLTWWGGPPFLRPSPRPSPQPSKNRR